MSDPLIVRVIIVRAPSALMDTDADVMRIDVLDELKRFGDANSEDGQLLRAYIHANWTDPARINPLARYVLESVLMERLSVLPKESVWIAHASGAYPSTDEQLIDCLNTLCVVQKRLDDSRTPVRIKTRIAADPHGNTEMFKELTGGECVSIADVQAFLDKYGVDELTEDLLKADTTITGMIDATPVENAVIVQLYTQLLDLRAHRFAGSHPISLDRESMPRLLRYPYLCALKIDGHRVLCVVHNERLWFIDRRLRVLHTSATTVIKPSLAPFEGTILDGELCVLDERARRVQAREDRWRQWRKPPLQQSKTPTSSLSIKEAADMLEEERTPRLVYYVFDALRVGSTDVRRRPIMERLAHSIPLGRLFFNSSVLRFRAQEYVDRTQIEQLIDRSFHRYDRAPDGIIFQPAKLPARAGVDYNLFKWKPLHRNSVDLYVGDNHQLYVRKTSEQNPVIDDTVRDDNGGDGDGDDGSMLCALKHGTLHMDKPAWLRTNTVVECAPLFTDDRQLQWVPIHERGDKLSPNADWVVDRIVASIAQNITERELIDYCQQPPLHPRDVPSPPPVRRII